ncbi:hypothetical protein ACHAPU_010270 [Fusarium lateritium]
MSSFACLQSSRRALYRVFVEHSPRQFLPTTQRTLPLHHNRFFSASPLQLKARRENPRLEDQDSEFIDEEKGYDRRYTTQDEFAKSGRDRLPKDHEIKDPKIMVLDNGVFDGPLLTRNVLSRLADTESLRMVTPYIRADPKNNKDVQYAICKIVNKKEEYERQRELHERRRVSKQTSAKKKDLEMSWAISDHDLKIKTKQLVSFLEKGMKVEVVLGFKKKGQKKRTSEDTTEEVFAKVTNLVKDLGSKEYKPREGEVGRTMRIYLEGISKQKAPEKEAAPEKAALEEAAPVEQEAQAETEAPKDANV